MANATRSREEERDEGQPRANGEVSARQGPLPFRVVLPVRSEVSEVVQDVDGRGEEAEREEREDSRREDRSLEDVPRDEGNEDEDVLDPLPHPERRQDGPEAARTVGQLGGHRRAGLLHLGPETDSRPDEDRLPRAPEDGQVGPRVAGVVEALLAEAVHERGPLLFPLEVSDAVAREDLVEQADPRRRSGARGARRRRSPGRAVFPSPSPRSGARRAPPSAEGTRRRRDRPRQGASSGRPGPPERVPRALSVPGPAPA